MSLERRARMPSRWSYRNLSESQARGVVAVTHQCDADRVLAALTGNPEVHHSGDIFEIWHGMDTPAYACGYHSTPLGNMQLINVFRGHRARMGVPQVISIITHNGEHDKEVTVT